ncbi:hypothetical protein SUGI_1143940 [Cryptomeria japonica]|nr:hypothetical protein SUGI_1143940 [Cryptomeria japonica]
MVTSSREKVSTTSRKSGTSGHISSAPSSLCRHFIFVEIQEATNNFDESGILGFGGFGKVYEGEGNLLLFKDLEFPSVRKSMSAGPKATPRVGTPTWLDCSACEPEGGVEGWNPDIVGLRLLWDRKRCQGLQPRCLQVAMPTGLMAASRVGTPTSPGTGAHEPEGGAKGWIPNVTRLRRSHN